MTGDLLTLSYYMHDQLPGIRQTLLDVYAEVYEEDIKTRDFFLQHGAVREAAG